MFRIRRHTAEKIIQEVSSILPYDINIMNDEGIILASTDSARIDCFHEGAFKIINENLPDLSVYRDDEWEGCRKGIKLPILFDNQLIGVIRITGEVDKVSVYDHLLKKMTEVMAKNIFITWQESLKGQEISLFLFELLNGKVQKNVALNKLERWDIQGSDSYWIIIHEISNSGQRISLPKSIHTQFNDIGIFLTNMSKSSLEKCLLSACERDPRVVFYIGEPVDSVDSVSHSYQTAMVLLDYIGSSSDTNLISYSNHYIEVALKELGKSVKERYIMDIFKTDDIQKISEYIELILLYEKYNGSINKMSETLHMHKNSVQYRINRLNEISGLDIRRKRDYFYLKLATIIIGNMKI